MADDKIICYPVFELSQINFKNVLSLFSNNPFTHFPGAIQFRPVFSSSKKYPLNIKMQKYKLLSVFLSLSVSFYNFSAIASFR